MSPTDQAAGNNQLSPAQNPQAASTQAAPSALNTLQTPSANILNSSEKLSITSVGDSTSSPIRHNQTTTNPLLEQSMPNTNHHYPILIGSGLVILLCVLGTWLMIRSSHKQGTQKQW